MSKSTPPDGDHPSRHPLSHHTDSSGAHVRGTHHHMTHAHNPHDGLTEDEAGDSKGSEAGDTDQFSRRGNEGGAEMSIPEHPTELELPALSHNRGKQE